MYVRRRLTTACLACPAQPDLICARLPGSPSSARFTRGNATNAVRPHTHSQISCAILRQAGVSYIVCMYVCMLPPARPGSGPGQGRDGRTPPLFSCCKPQVLWREPSISLGTGVRARGEKERWVCSTLIIHLPPPSIPSRTYQGRTVSSPSAYPHPARDGGYIITPHPNPNSLPPSLSHPAKSARLGSGLGRRGDTAVADRQRPVRLIRLIGALPVGWGRSPVWCVFPAT